MTMFAELAAEFPREAVHWRAQTLTKDGDKALALAYIDARDVMDRLDAVCGPAGWRDSYTETAKGRVIGTIEILVNGEWVGKSDGAGDTDVEGDKGGMSDAFKRTAVKWGIGRYLYRLPNVWAPCESREWNGKKQWTKWKGSPWDAIRVPPRKDPTPKDVEDAASETISEDQRDIIATTAEAAGVTLQAICKRYSIDNILKLRAETYGEVIQSLNLTIEKKKKENA